MNDFDRLVEFQLKRMLDPVVASRVPPRRMDGKRKSIQFLAVAPAALELAPETIGVVIDPIVVATRPAQPAGLIP